MFIEPTHDAAAAFFGNPPTGPVVMLNLLRFRATANYGAHPKLAPAEPITGAKAYARYAAHTMPFLSEAGGKVLFQGTSGAYFIGPADARWDMVLLVRYPSADVFRRFASNEGYLAGIGHRVAALEDSRLLPISE